MPALGSAVHFRGAGSAEATVGVALLLDNGRWLVAVAPGSQHATELAVGEHRVGLTWVPMKAVVDGIPAGRSALTLGAAAKDVLKEYLTAAQEAFESPAEEAADTGVESLQKMGTQLAKTVKDLQITVQSLVEGQHQLATRLGQGRGGSSRDLPEETHPFGMRQPPPERSSVPPGQVPSLFSSLHKNTPFWTEEPDEEEDDDEEDDGEDARARSSRTSRRRAKHGRKGEKPLDPLDAMLRGQAPPAAGDVNGLVTLAVLQELRKMRKRESSDSSGSESEDGGWGGGTGKKSGGLKGVSALRRRYRRHPEKLTNAYEKMAKKIIGVTDERQVWAYRDVSKRLLRTFGRMKGLWRCHAGLAEIIQMLMDGDEEHALAFACQMSKALHQVGLDKGSWDTALLMLPTPDALGEPSFGGEEQELAAIQSYRKAIRELKMRQVMANAGGNDDNDDGVDTSTGGTKLTKKQRAALAKKKKAEGAAGGAAAGAKSE